MIEEDRDSKKQTERTMQSNSTDNSREGDAELAPEDLLNRRIEVHGFGRGLVVAFNKKPLFGDSLHTIEFDEGSEILRKRRLQYEKQIVEDSSDSARSDDAGNYDRAELQRAFTRASGRVSSIRSKLTTEQLLALYALYKQTTQGDAPEAVFDADEKQAAKWAAWNGARGLKGGEAAFQYVELLASYDQAGEIQFTPQHRHGNTAETRQIEVLLRRKKMGRWNQGHAYRIIDAFVESLENYYRQHAPSKLDQVPEIADRFRGKYSESEVFRALEKKYGCTAETEMTESTPSRRKVAIEAMKAAERLQESALKTRENEPVDSNGSSDRDEENKWAAGAPVVELSGRASMVVESTIGLSMDLASKLLGDNESSDEDEGDIEEERQQESDIEGSAEEGEAEPIGIHGVAILAATEKNASYYAVFAPLFSLMFVFLQVIILVLIIQESGGITCSSNDECSEYKGTYCASNRCYDCGKDATLISNSMLYSDSFNTISSFTAIILAPKLDFDRAPSKLSSYRKEGIVTPSDQEDYDYCARSDEYLHKCDYIVEARKNLTVAKAFVLVVILLLLGVAPLEDLDEAMYDRFIYDQRIHLLRKNAWKKRIVKISYQAFHRMRVFILQPMVAGATISLLLLDDLTVQNILLNGLAIGCIVQMDDMLVLFVHPVKLMKYTEMAPKKDSDKGREYFNAPLHTYIWYLNRVMICTVSILSFTFILFPSKVVNMVVGHKFCGDYTYAILLVVYIVGTAWSLFRVFIKTYVDYIKSSKSESGKKQSISAVIFKMLWKAAGAVIMNGFIFMGAGYLGSNPFMNRNL